MILMLGESIAACDNDNDNKIIYFDITQKQDYYIRHKQMCVKVISWRSY